MLDLLEETGLLEYELANTPMELDLDIQSEDSTLYEDDKQ